MYAELFRLDGRVALVTGGSRGIGLACAQALGEAGARVAISSRSREEGEKAVNLLQDNGIHAIYLLADISSEGAAQALVRQAVADLGGLDILVNNAGITRPCDSLKETPDNWNEVINTNLTGLFWCCRAAIETMITKESGSIVNIGSISGYISNLPQNQVSYNASKAGVHMLTKSLAGEFVKNSIRINAIAPGYIETAMTQYGLADPECSKIWRDMTPMARTGKPSEVAAAVLFLASDAASYITGSVLTIDGGYTIH